MNRAMINRFIIAPLLALGIAGLVASCASPKPIRVTVTQLSPAARATVERVTLGGTIERIAKAAERGRIVYEVGATVNGKHLELLVAYTDGAVLGTAVTIDYHELPAAVRAAAEKYFDTASGLTAMKGDRDGEGFYQIEGPKDGKRVEVTFDPKGKRTR